MNRITHCVYCGRPITTPSKEHIIHNALGGLYESTGIRQSRFHHRREYLHRRRSDPADDLPRRQRLDAESLIAIESAYKKERIL